MIYLSEDMLNRLTTPRLLALYRSVRKAIDVKSNELENDPKANEYKDYIKVLLFTREHVERAP